MGVKICPKCNGKVSTSRNICIHCGYVFLSTKKCPDCGEAVDENAFECPECGYLFSAPASTNGSSIGEKETAADGEVETNVPKENASSSNEIESSAGVDENGTALEGSGETKGASQGDSVIHDDDTNTYADGDVTESPHECPYCGSLSLMPIGVGVYMCETCKGKFTDAFRSCGNALVKGSETTKNASVQSDTTESVDNGSDTEETAQEFEVRVEGRCEETDVGECENKGSRFCKSKKKMWIIIACLTVVFGVLTGTVFVPLSQYYIAMAILDEFEYVYRAYDPDSDSYSIVYGRDHCSFDHYRSQLGKAYKILNHCYWKDSDKQCYFITARLSIREGYFGEAIYYMTAGGGDVCVSYNCGYSSVSISDTHNTITDEIPFVRDRNFAGWEFSSYHFENNNYSLALCLSAKYI